MDPEREILSSVPVHNAKVEAALLGGLLRQLPCPGERPRELNSLKGEHFYVLYHRVIFEAVQAHAAQTETPFNATDVYLAQLQAHRDAPRLMDLILELDSGSPTVLELARWSRELKALWRKRQTSQRFLRAAYEVSRGQDTAEVWAATESDLSVIHSEHEKGPKSLATALWEVLGGSPPETIQTRLRPLDEALDGLAERTLIVVGAQPSIGKSALVSQILLNVSRQGFLCGFISLEMDKVSMATRLACQITGVGYRNIRHRALTEGEKHALIDAHDELEKLPLQLLAQDEDPTVRQVDRIMSLTRQWAREGARIVAIDYGQKVVTPGRHTQRDDLKYHEVFHGLKDLANQTGLCVIAASQVRRDQDRPTLSGLKGSGAIEEAADQVVLLHAPGGRECGMREVIVAKNKNGPCTSFALELDGPCMRFTETDKPLPEPKRGGWKAKGWK